MKNNFANGLPSDLRDKLLSICPEETAALVELIKTTQALKHHTSDSEIKNGSTVSENFFMKYIADYINNAGPKNSEDESINAPLLKNSRNHLIEYSASSDPFPNGSDPWKEAREYVEDAKKEYRRLFEKPYFFASLELTLRRLDIFKWMHNKNRDFNLIYQKIVRSSHPDRKKSCSHLNMDEGDRLKKELHEIPAEHEQISDQRFEELLREIHEQNRFSLEQFRIQLQAETSAKITKHIKTQLVPCILSGYVNILDYNGADTFSISDILFDFLNNLPHKTIGNINRVVCFDPKQKLDEVVARWSMSEGEHDPIVRILYELQELSQVMSLEKIADFEVQERLIGILATLGALKPAFMLTIYYLFPLVSCLTWNFGQYRSATELAYMVLEEWKNAAMIFTLEPVEIRTDLINLIDQKLTEMYPYLSHNNASHFSIATHQNHAGLFSRTSNMQTIPPHAASSSTLSN